MSEKPTEIHDTDIERQTLEYGMQLSKILKGKLKRQQKKNHHGWQQLSNKY